MLSKHTISLLPFFDVLRAQETESGRERAKSDKQKVGTVIYQVIVILVYDAHLAGFRANAVCMVHVCVAARGDCDAFKLHFFLDCYCVLFACLCQWIFTHYRMMMIRSDEHFHALGIGRDAIKMKERPLLFIFISSHCMPIQSHSQHLF